MTEDMINLRDFVEKTLERDLVWLMDFYRSEGYRDVRAWLGDLRFSEDLARLEVDLGDVDVAPPCSLAEVETAVRSHPDLSGHRGAGMQYGRRTARLSVANR